MVENLVDDVFEVRKEAIDRVSRRRSIEATAQPDNRVPKFSFNGTNAVDVLVVAVEKPTHQLWWFVVPCSPRLRRGEHVELFEKLEGEVLEQRQRLGLHDIEERVYRRIILQGRWTHPPQHSPCSLVCYSFYDTLP